MKMRRLAQLALMISGPEYKGGNQTPKISATGLADGFVCFYTLFEKPLRRWNTPGLALARSREVIQKLSPQISQNYDPSKFVLISELKGLFIKFSACSAQDILP